MFVCGKAIFLMCDCFSFVELMMIRWMMATEARIEEIIMKMDRNEVNIKSM